jgi:hypothetical protein
MYDVAKEGSRAGTDKKRRQVLHIWMIKKFLWRISSLRATPQVQQLEK